MSQPLVPKVDPEEKKRLADEAIARAARQASRRLAGSRSSSRRRQERCKSECGADTLPQLTKVAAMSTEQLSLLKGVVKFGPEVLYGVLREASSSRLGLAKSLLPYFRKCFVIGDIPEAVMHVWIWMALCTSTTSGRPALDNAINILKELSRYMSDCAEPAGADNVRFRWKDGKLPGTAGGVGDSLEKMDNILALCEFYKVAVPDCCNDVFTAKESQQLLRTLLDATDDAVSMPGKPVDNTLLSQFIEGVPAAQNEVNAFIARFGGLGGESEEWTAIKAKMERVSKCAV